jgi:hypothetical protein
MAPSAAKTAFPLCKIAHRGLLECDGDHKIRLQALDGLVQWTSGVVTFLSRVTSKLWWAVEKKMASPDERWVIASFAAIAVLPGVALAELADASLLPTDYVLAP